MVLLPTKMVLFVQWSLLTEYMPGGNLYEYLHKNHIVLKLPQLLKFAIDVCRGMEYLHQNNIIHRDLKTANLLMDNDNVSIFISWLNSIVRMSHVQAFSSFLMCICSKYLYWLLYCKVEPWSMDTIIDKHRVMFKACHFVLTGRQGWVNAYMHPSQVTVSPVIVQFNFPIVGPCQKLSKPSVWVQIVLTCRIRNSQP